MAVDMNAPAAATMTAREENREPESKRRGAAPAAKAPTQAEHVRETADSIVVAFILAFVFRAFIIEAFVIPTGSMAATLYGRHGTMICGDCGWEYAYGLTDPSSIPPPGSPLPSPQLYGPNDRAVCPNCANHDLITQINDRRGNSEAGDRILALKWPYDVGGSWLGPRRWDVALFKDPSDTELKDGVTNFIKRLVGVPHEVLEIIDGDVYVAPVEKLSPKVLEAIDQARRAKFLRQHTDNHNSAEAQAIEQRLGRIWPEILDELSDSLRICRKTPLAQKALWNVVYNHDYPPRELDPDQPYWGQVEGGDGWEVGPRKLHFEPSGDALAGIALRNRRIVDFNGYNLRSNGEQFGVTDLRLRMVLTLEREEGFVLLRLPKREKTFWARIDSDGTLALYQTSGALPTTEKPLATTKLAPLRANRPVSVDFQNLDYRVSLALDGREYLATSDQQFSPDVRALRKLDADVDPGQVQVYARGMALELSHVAVERDVYYRSPRRNLGPMAGLSQLTGAVWGGTGNPIWLREGEFFMLGDNSAASGDSRLWSVIGAHLEDRGEACQLGTVPRDQLIGRAFFVYWPSGHRSDIIPFLDRIALIPDVGRMRWIR